MNSLRPWNIIDLTWLSMSQWGKITPTLLQQRIALRNNFFWTEEMAKITRQKFPEHHKSKPVKYNSGL